MGGRTEKGRPPGAKNSSRTETGGSNLLEEHHFGINGSVLKLRTKTDCESGPRAGLAGTVGYKGKKGKYAIKKTAFVT